MRRFYALLRKINPIKLWPPFIRAYRQNAAGQPLSRAQSNYLKWGSNFLIFLFSLAWFIFYLPYFSHQGKIGLFAYTNSFVTPFFDSNNPLRATEFIWRWVSQFYLNVPLICLVVSFMVAGFCITSRKTVGPYTPFLLPLFFLLFPSPDPSQASIAIGLWLIMGALAIYAGLSRYAARRPRYVFPLILLHLFAALSSTFLYYATGHWALMFGIATVLVHLIGIPMSRSDKEEGLFKIRIINFLLTSVIILTTGIVFWKHASYAPFHAAWYVWVSLVIYALACIPGLVLQAYNNRKVYLYEWKKRKGEVLDGKPALSSPFHVLLTLVAICIGFLLFLFSRAPETRTLMRVENAIEKGHYGKSLSLCEAYLGTNNEKAANKKRNATVAANIRADYKLSLLMEGRLNQEGDNPLLAEMFPEPTPEMEIDNYTYLALCEALGLKRGTLSLVLDDIDKNGLQNRYFVPLLRSSLELQQYNLFRNALYLAKRTLGKADAYYYYSGLSRNLLASYEHDSVIVLKADDPLAIRQDGFIDDWVCDAFERDVFGGRLNAEGNKIYVTYHSPNGKVIRRQLTANVKLQKPSNVALLEYYTFLALKDGKTALLPYLRHVYRLAGFEEELINERL